MAVAQISQENRNVSSYVQRDPAKPPALQTGDHLTREEFERRYKAMPHVKKAELIEGVVYMPSPVYRAHGWAHGQIMSWLGVYCASTSHVNLYDNTSVRLDLDNEVQPDALLMIESDAEKPILSEETDDYIESSPQLIVELAASSASYDLHEKLKVYRRNRVQEYVVWQLYENHLDWFQLKAGKYIPLDTDADGIIHSQVFPGLQLAVESLLAGDMAEVIAVLQNGVQTKEHAAFVQYLRDENR
jgi:Uma2 family endonuclease